MQIDLNRHKYVLYEGDRPVAFFSNERLACETAYVRWRWNPYYFGRGALMLRGNPLRHSVQLPDGKFIHACDMSMDCWDYRRAIRLSDGPWLAPKPEAMPAPHWAVL